MRIDTVKTKVYKFNELNDEAKEKAIMDLHDINTDFDWWCFVFDDAIEIGKIIGIDIDKIYFSGFYSQGDGACFDGSYEYKKGALKNIRQHAPKDNDLHEIAESLQTLQRKCFYSAAATINQSGHYMHENCTNIDTCFENYNGSDYYSNDNHDDLKDCLRDFMRWIYRRLEKENDYLTSESAIIESIESNDYEFTADGSIY